jgi:hypothetical protein
MATREQRESRKTEILSRVTLCNLDGSEKQIAWATKIRATKLDYLGLCLAVEELSQEEKPRAGSELEFVRGVLTHVATISDSRWWIDCRDSTEMDNPLFWSGERKYKFSPSQ